MWVPPVGRAPRGRPGQGESAGAGGPSPPLRRPPAAPGEPGPGPASWRRLAVGGGPGRGPRSHSLRDAAGVTAARGEADFVPRRGGAGAGREGSAVLREQEGPRGPEPRPCGPGQGLAGRGGVSRAGAGLQGALDGPGWGFRVLGGWGRGFRGPRRTGGGASGVLGAGLGDHLSASRSTPEARSPGRAL